jgi:hypothetical protein
MAQLLQKFPYFYTTWKVHIYNSLALGPVLIIYNYEIWGYHRRVDKDPSILAYDAMSNGTQLLMFQKSLLSPCLNQSNPKNQLSKTHGCIPKGRPTAAVSQLAQHPWTTISWSFHLLSIPSFIPLPSFLVPLLNICWLHYYTSINLTDVNF